MRQATVTGTLLTKPLKEDTHILPPSLKNSEMPERSKRKACAFSVYPHPLLELMKDKNLITQKPNSINFSQIVPIMVKND